MYVAAAWLSAAQVSKQAKWQQTKALFSCDVNGGFEKHLNFLNVVLLVIMGWIYHSLVTPRHHNDPIEQSEEFPVICKVYHLPDHASSCSKDTATLPTGAAR